MACTRLVHIVAACEIELARAELLGFVGPRVVAVRQVVKVLVAKGLHMGLLWLCDRASQVKCPRVIQLVLIKVVIHF